MDKEKFSAALSIARQIEKVGNTDGARTRRVLAWCAMMLAAFRPESTEERVRKDLAARREWRRFRQIAGAA